MSFQHFRVAHLACVAVVVAGAGNLIVNLNAQTDPGPRGGSPGAGGRFQTLDFNETLLFTQVAQRFAEVDSVSGTIPNETGSGLGPTFNGNACTMCHAQPA